MRHFIPRSLAPLLPVAGVMMLLGGTPALAQTAEDPATDPALAEDVDTGETDGTATELASAEAAPEEEGLLGTFSRMIPSGLKSYFSEEEEQGFQAALDEAATPQERNEVRRELQRLNQERHLEEKQAMKQERHQIREQRREEKGLFASMKADFDSIVSGEARDKGFSRGARDVSPSENRTADARGGKSGAHGNVGGGRDKDRGDRGGRDRDGRGGGNGGGNGGGRNK